MGKIFSFLHAECILFWRFAANYAEITLKHIKVSTYLRTVWSVGIKYDGECPPVDQTVCG